MAVLCLLAGLAIGYVSRGTPLSSALARTVSGAKNPVTTRDGTASSPIPDASIAGNAKAMSNKPAHALTGHMPDMAEMKQMADKHAAPLLEKLKKDPNNGPLLGQVGAIYHSEHQFKDAATYYGQAVQVDPRNVELRNKLATSLYRSGDVDGAINQLNQALRYDPKDANSLFNLGIIRLHGKEDGKGAVAAWQQLLKSNPQLSADRKETVQKLMAEVLTTLSDQGGAGGKTHDGHKPNTN
jgi:cytochrome c-type biogenesis protein CcmH/NrfG